MHVYPTITRLAMIIGPAVLLSAQPAIQMGTLYQCPAGQGFKVFSCAGATDAASCDVQAFTGGQPGQRGPAPHAQVMALLQVCHALKPGEAPAAASPARSATQADANGFKIGDTVQVNTGFGWIDGKILAMNGNNYRVHTQNGVDVDKTYPAELHRNGPLTERDRAAGLYNLHERVQVNFEGRWVDSEIVTIMGMEYQVTMPGNRTVWAKPENLKYVGPPLKAAVPQAGTAPQPGLVSCAGKIEGRYASTGGFGNLTITFRSGKATIPGLGGDETFECWMKGEKIYLHTTGQPASTDMPIDINNDGSLQTPLGEIKKKGN